MCFFLYIYISHVRFLPHTFLVKCAIVEKWKKKYVDIWSSCISINETEMCSIITFVIILLFYFVWSLMVFFTLFALLYNPFYVQNFIVKLFLFIHPTYKRDVLKKKETNKQTKLESTNMTFHSFYQKWTSRCTVLLQNSVYIMTITSEFNHTFIKKTWSHFHSNDKSGRNEYLTLFIFSYYLNQT